MFQSPASRSLLALGAICITVGTLIMPLGSYHTGVGDLYNAASVGATGSSFLFVFCTVRYWLPMIFYGGSQVRMNRLQAQLSVPTLLRQYLILRDPAHIIGCLLLFSTAACLLGYRILELLRGRSPVEFTLRDALHVSLFGAMIINITFFLLRSGADLLIHIIPLILQCVRSIWEWILTHRSTLLSRVELFIVDDMAGFLVFTLTWTVSALFSLPLAIMAIADVFLISRRYAGATGVIMYTAAGAVVLFIAINYSAPFQVASFVGAIIWGIMEYRGVGGSGLN